MEKTKMADMFKTHKMNTEEIELSQAIRNNFMDFADYIDNSIPDGREKAIIMTNLEQSLFYSTAAIARNK